ncbi:DNA damage-responsive transcriptional repressor RPH1 [Echria macrotheca]|uniref:[histone H3]-trimethyl-L-lysine(9) demethylase n=1 Tax=Echria macrotheca TaxID=438768 RepID=A0AAJ0FAY5_9PEZI|nr:DNA damage-responsive transcriptional repressor RPH1 [Echria macrotheca]
MSTEAIGAAAPEATIVMAVDDKPAAASAGNAGSTGLHSPPDSNNAMNLDASDSELSDIDEVAHKLGGELHVDDVAPTPVKAEPEAPKVEVEDIGEVLPDHFSGTVPVFRPTMRQFRDFKLFMEKIDKYGMKSGIVKIIPPKEWKDSLKPLDDLVKQIRVREPIKQDIMGSNGVYRQVNLLHGRSYNLPQWRQLCDQSEHQPPARRGERRANAEKHKPVRSTRSAATTASKSSSAAGKRKRGRPSRTRKSIIEEEDDAEDQPMTPVSPPPEKEEVVDSVEQDPGMEDECDDDDDAPVVRRMGGFSRQSKPKTQSTSARRKYSRREGSAMIDEEAFRNFDYQMDVSEYTPERCEELERTYWKTLTFAPPLYGADLMGTLFDESTELWNLNKLPNLLDVLGTKVPGVNTAYLYLGMWKATFAWHLEDVDLYSINYLHFGAPKQWYSISQADARRFEAAMKNIFPTDAKACDQFLRHKSFLISPAHLKQQYNITVNKCVSYPGEFVVTYPYGYHSGYNLGYNCAEAVNFALDSWLPMGKIAKKCQCAQAQDSVWVDVYEIERKLRGEETEYEETEDEDDEDDEDDDHDTGLPSPPNSHTIRAKGAGRKRKRAVNDQGDGKPKKVRLRLKTQVEPPCCLCPHDIPGAQIMPTDDGRKAHRMCALYLPETYIETVDDKEIIANVAGIDKARLDLKCLYCRSKKGACFQCSQKKCPRSYHATCAAAAGVFVEEAEVPVFGEDGTEYKEQAFEFSCRFHRTKRDRKQEGKYLEDNAQVREAALSLKKYDICQMQYFRGDIFAGVVLENRRDEETLLLQVIPHGDQVEVEWKWLLLPDPADLRLPKASPNAIPLPTSRKAQKELNAKRAVDDLPRKDDEFGPGFHWAEFHTCDPIKNPDQVSLDLTKESQVWHYLGKTSTESKAQYTRDVSRPQHDPQSNFLDSIPKPPKPVPALPQARRAFAPPEYLPKVTPVPLPGTAFSHKKDRPYVYKPRQPMGTELNIQFTMQHFAPNLPGTSQNPMLPQMQPPQFAPHSPLPQPVRLEALQPQYGPRSQPRQQPPPPPPPPPSGIQFMQYQPVAKDQPQKNPSTVYSSDRFAPVGGINGFPQLPGLTWPPAHIISGYHPQPESSPADAAAATGPALVPMTSSTIKSLVSGHSQGAAGAQPLTSAKRYTFFKVYHNRDHADYKTPYNYFGGFTNGYEGNFRKFMEESQRALSGGKSPTRPHKRRRLMPLEPRLEVSPSHDTLARYSSPSNRILPRPEPTSHGSRFPAGGPQLPTLAPYPPDKSMSPAPSTSGGSSLDMRQPSTGVSLHSAIRPQFGGPGQPGTPSGEYSWIQPQQPSTGSGHTYPQSHQTALSKLPAFTKQSHSPIPLPSYIQHGVASSETNGGRASPLSQLFQNPFSGSEPTSEFGHHPPRPTSTAPLESVTSHYSQTGHHDSMQEVQWAQLFEAPRSTPPAVAQVPTTMPDAPMEQYHLTEPEASEYADPSTSFEGSSQVFGESDSPDNSDFMERMMLNLKRATGRSD